MEKTDINKNIEQYQKKFEIDEETDIFLYYINKKNRNLSKKLEQIQELQKKDIDNLKPEQVEKVNSKKEVQQELEKFLEMKLHYYISHDKAQQTSASQMLKKSENSILKIQLSKARDDFLKDMQKLLTSGRLLQSQKFKFEQDIKIQDQDELYQFYEQYILMHGVSQDDINLSLRQYSDKCSIKLGELLEEADESSKKLKKNLDKIWQDIQNIQIKDLEIEKNEQRKVDNQNEVEVIDEKDEKSEKSEDCKEEKEKEDFGRDSRTFNYEGDSENSQINKSSSEYKDLRSSDLAEKESNRKKQGYQKGGYQFQGGKRFYYKKREFEDSYDDGRKNQNYYPKNRNPNRSNNYYKDYDTDKEKQSYKKQYKYQY